jgi:hypothetical protein
MAVVLRVFCDPDGTVRNVLVDERHYDPADETFFRAFAESAVRAVRKASPLQLPSGKEDQFKSFLLNFSGKDMLAGIRG